MATGGLVVTIDQGVAMGRPSVLHASAEWREGQVRSIRIAGRSVVVAEGYLYI